jgi:uncharacterized protein (DUF983 family)
MTEEFRGSMFGGHEEYVDKCATCGSLMYHMHDKNDIMPFWYIVEKIPDLGAAYYEIVKQDGGEPCLLASLL